MELGLPIKANGAAKLGIRSNNGANNQLEESQAAPQDDPDGGGV